MNDSIKSFRSITWFFTLCSTAWCSPKYQLISQKRETVCEQLKSLFSFAEFDHPITISSPLYVLNYYWLTLISTLSSSAEVIVVPGDLRS